MRTLVQLALGLLIVVRASGENSEHVDCSEGRCEGFAYCNVYSNTCEKCSSLCNETDRIYDKDVCDQNCQDYLVDMYGKAITELRGITLKVASESAADLEKLRTLVTVAIAMACLSLLGTLWLFAKRVARWNKLHGPLHRAFTGKWMKKTGAATANNNNNNNSNNNRTTLNDAEIGGTRQNGLVLMMPTISASVAPSRNDSGNVSGNSSGSRSGSGSASGLANNTPNTTITALSTLSTRHPSEDTTLDYAYDNPAMTPSPEAVQLRTNRESSF